MKNILTSILLLLLMLRLPAEEVTMIVISLPENTPPEDNIFVAGNFNGWNPGDPAFMLNLNNQDRYEISFEGEGTIEFKFTRGSWETVEGNENGGFLPNRSFTFGTADTLEITILSWEDLGGNNHTAADNVIVMDEDFYMPQLDRYRRIWLYLPPDYDSSGLDYPVLYMHDGQNLFDAATSFAGEWEVDETLNAIYDEGKDVPIVVGIDNGGVDRIDEYTPWPNPQYGGGDGDLYAQFIVETLKPYIDENYRTKPQRDFTGVMGSSLGGLISHYIGMKYQDVFSKTGIFSPSYWFTGDIYDFTFETGKQHDMQFYIMGGTDEGPGLVEEMNAMKDTLQAAGFSPQEMTMKVVEGGQHNEALWRQEFGQAYEWMYLQSSTGIVHPATNPDINIEIYGNSLIIRHPDFPHKEVLVKAFSITGQELFTARAQHNAQIPIPGYRSGIYFFILISGQESVEFKRFLR